MYMRTVLSKCNYSACSFLSRVLRYQFVFYASPLSHLQLMVPHDYENPPNGKFNIAFILQRSSTDSAARLEGDLDDCFHEHKLNEDDELIPLSFRTTWKEMKFEKKITIPGYYHLYFSNCEKSTHSSFELSLTEYNVDPRTGAKIFLSAGKASLPTWFFVLCGSFIVQLGVWTNVLRKQRQDIRTIHYLMTVVLVLKIFTLFFESLKYHSLKTTGHNNGWSVMFYIFSFLKGTLMFAVIILIGTGWSYLKPFLTDRDKQIMLAVLVVQLIVNIAMVIVDETAPGSAGWLTWSDILHLLDMICCCVILLPIVWSIRHLRQAAAADGKGHAHVSGLSFA